MLSHGYTVLRNTLKCNHIFQNSLPLHNNRQNEDSFDIWFVLFFKLNPKYSVLLDIGIHISILIKLLPLVDQLTHYLYLFYFLMSLQEIEEASARLRASKSKVDELETSISSSRESSAGYEAQRREMTRELDRLRSELTDAQQAKEDLAQVGTV